MVHFVTILQTSQDGNGILHRRLIHHDRLETTLQSSVLFNVLTILVESCGADTMQLAPCQHRLQQVTGIHGAFRLTGAHDGMQLINEQQNLSVAGLNLLQYRFQTLLKLAPVFGACHQGTHIEGKHLFILQGFRHIALDDTLRQPLHNGSLSNARLTDQYRVILGLSGKNPHYISYLAVTADDRIKLLLSRSLHQIITVFLQRLIGCLRIIAHNLLIASHSRQRLQKTLPGHAVSLKQFLNFLIRMLQQRQEKMLHRHILIAHGLGLILRTDQHLI